ncbi:hypothetical protein [Lutibaculum baratangense]|uniref:hypothetical protein n=1 Tax=Lutibaculum baratangense TaxID=1358440 RepID=UPI0012683BEE|nr:hypothetical protein [Lutibaculum baratangense]
MDDRVLASVTHAASASVSRCGAINSRYGINVAAGVTQIMEVIDSPEIDVTMERIHGGGS